MLCNVIKNAQDGDSDAMMELIQKFRPLLASHSIKLQYEDAFEDCVLFFIELITHLHLERIQYKKDGAVVSYISTSVSNFCKKSAYRQAEIKKEIVLSDLTEEQLYYVEARSAKEDSYDVLLELGVKDLLSEKEQMVLYLIYIRGYSISELARTLHKSRQAVSQLKQRALQKIRNRLFST